MPRPNGEHPPVTATFLAVPHPAFALGSECATAVRLTSAHPVRRSRAWLMTRWQVSWLAGRRFRPPSQETEHFPVAPMAGDSPPTVAGAAAELCAGAHAPHSLTE